MAKTAASGTPRPTLHCSFCCRSEHEVARLVAGPSVCICDECANLCAGFVNNKEPSPTAIEPIPMQLLTILENPDVPAYIPDRAGSDYRGYSRDELVAELGKYVVAWEVAGVVIDKLLLVLEETGLSAAAVDDALTPKRRAALNRFRARAASGPPHSIPGKST